MQSELSPSFSADLSLAQVIPGFFPRRAGAAEVLALCFYSSLLAWAIPHHEPWADEAQAWQIARTLSLPQMFHALHYEGHPGLWYLLLWILSRLHVSYAGMHWVAGAIAVVGVSVLVLASPFPRFVKLLLPFTFYLAYQYAIVGRSYVIAPLLLFLCAYVWPQKRDHPLRLALCLGLLANVVLHAAVISGGFAIAWLFDLILEKRRTRLAIEWRKLVPAAALLLSLYAVAIAAAFPAKDTSGAGLLVRPNPEVKQRLDAQQSQLPLLIRSQPVDKRSLNWLAWKIEIRLSSGLTQGLIRPFWLGCLFWGVLAWKLFKTGKLHYLIPPLLFVVFCAYVYAWFWHSGLMLLCVLCILWITSPPPDAAWNRLPFYEKLPLLMLLLVAIVQIGWAGFGFTFDHGHAYAPGAATAVFLKPYVASHASILQIGDDYLSVATQPYFAGKLYLNEPYAYYWWSTENTTKSRYQELLLKRPAIVVLEWRFRQAHPSHDAIASIPLARQLTNNGYRNTHTNCGGLVQPGYQFLEWDCDLIFEPLSVAP